MAKSIAKPLANEDRYRICESILDFDVQREVSDLMAAGWRPWGNLVVTQKPENSDGNQYQHYAQAMIRDVDDQGSFEMSAEVAAMKPGNPFAKARPKKR